MFILNKYTPKNFNTSLINKTIIKKLKNLNKSNLNNITFYGSNGTGKYVLSRMLLSHILVKIYIY